MTTHIYDMHGRTMRRSQNLRGIMDHYRANPADLVVKVAEAKDDPFSYEVTFYWPNGDHGVTRWADWRVLLHWLRARRSWSIARVTFDARVYDCHEDDEAVARFRKHGIPLTRHDYPSHFEEAIKEAAVTGQAYVKDGQVLTADEVLKPAESKR